MIMNILIAIITIVFFLTLFSLSHDCYHCGTLLLHPIDRYPIPILQISLRNEIKWPNATLSGWYCI